MRIGHYLAWMFFAAVIGLTGCGNDPTTSDVTNPIGLVGAALKARQDKRDGAAVDPAALAALHTALEKAGQPILLVVNGSLKFSALMAPYGSNGAVRTWGTEQYVTLSTRDDIVVATRGFGPDMMSSIAPSLSKIAAGQGTVRRRYYYLDGADQTQAYNFDCAIASEGGDTIAVLGKSYVTSRIGESCVGPTGSFKNQYWFDNRHILRQSSQFLVPGVDNLVLQRVVD